MSSCALDLTTVAHLSRSSDCSTSTTTATLLKTENRKLKTENECQPNWCQREKPRHAPTTLPSMPFITLSAMLASAKKQDRLPLRYYLLARAS